MQKKDEVSLKYLFFTFLKIGSVSWGGFMALISVVRKQLVEKDQTVKDEVILDGISLASVLPGPVAFNVVTYLGYTLKGISGAFVSMIAIILPSFFLILGLAFVYARYGQVPAFSYFFQGVLPAISAVIISVSVDMFKKQVKDYKQIFICISSGLVLIFIHSFFITLFVIIGGGIAGYLLYRESSSDNSPRVSQQNNWNIRAYRFPIILVVLVLIIFFLLPFVLKGAFLEDYKFLQTIFYTFSGMSLTLFGGGYVIIPTMQQIIVEGLHWLPTNEFVDAIAMGQITPGPIFISATFIGYRIAGFLGALVATIAVFFPPAIVMLIFSRFLNQIKQSKIITAVFKGLRPAIIGMIFSAAYTIGKEAELLWPSAIIFLTVLILLIRFKINVVYLIPMAGLAGVLLFQL